MMWAFFSLWSLTRGFAACLPLGIVRSSGMTVFLSSIAAVQGTLSTSTPKSNDVS